LSAINPLIVSLSFILGLHAALSSLLSPKVFVGTRAAFFTFINSIKVLAQLHAGLLDYSLLMVSVMQVR
jgi:hypothetical protein